MKNILSMTLAASTLLAGSAGAMADEFFNDVTADVSPQLPAPIVEFQQRQSYQPTILHSMAEVWRLYNMEDTLNHKSQCFERAEVWSNAISAATGYHLYKVMMFYTPRFRNEFIRKSSGFFGDSYSQYEWWFHTAPVVYLDQGQGPVAYVLDREFMKGIGPVTLDEWSHYFLNTEIFPGPGIIPQSNVSQLHLTNDQTHCQLLSDFRDYAIPTLNDQGPGKSGDLSDFTNWEARQNPNDAWCKMRVYPMYYMTPLDVQRMDCNPQHDVNYTLGLTGKHGTGIGSAVFQRLNDGRPKYPCAPLRLDGFNSNDLSNAQSSAHHRDPDSDGY